MTPQEVDAAKANGDRKSTTERVFSSTDQETRLASDTETAETENIADGSAEPMNTRKTVTVKNGSRQRPSCMNVLRVICSLQTWLVALPYLCSFGSELAVEGIISDFYIQTAKTRNGLTFSSETGGMWAALFGLLNVVTRPLGGYASDILYRKYGLVAKKWWLIFLGVMQGVFFIAVGTGNLEIYSLISVMAGLAIFMEAANGAIFSLVPAIHPQHTGVVSGVAGAFGNLGGVLFGLTFRLVGTDYHKALWIIGIVCISSNLAVACVPLRRTEN